jgi:hypothetical protein
MAADITAFPLNDLSRFGVADNPLGALLLAGNDGPAHFTMVSGKVRVWAGTLIDVDIDSIVREANTVAQRLVH